MRKFAIVLTALAAVLFVGGTAHAQSFSSGSVFIGGNRGVGVDIHIGNGRSHIGIHSGRHGGWRNDGGWRNRGPVYRGPIYRDNGCYNGGYRGCGGYQNDVITVRVQERVYDRYGNVYFQTRYVQAYYDSYVGAYVYVNRYGQRVIVR